MGWKNLKFPFSEICAEHINKVLTGRQDAEKSVAYFLFSEFSNYSVLCKIFLRVFLGTL
jgi:hypothetical protein